MFYYICDFSDMSQFSHIFFGYIMKKVSLITFPNLKRERKKGKKRCETETNNCSVWTETHVSKSTFQTESFYWCNFLGSTLWLYTAPHQIEPVSSTLDESSSSLNRSISVYAHIITVLETVQSVKWPRKMVRNIFCLDA